MNCVSECVKSPKMQRSPQKKKTPPPILKEKPSRQIIDVLDNQLEQLADELNRRQAASERPPSWKPDPPPHKKTSTAEQKKTSTTSTSSWRSLDEQRKTSSSSTSSWRSDEPKKKVSTSSTGSSSSSSSAASKPSTFDEDDPAQMLNAWLGELDSLQKGLDSVPLTTATLGRRDSFGRSVSSRESSATPVHMRRMSTPRVESPRLDSYRYSLINLEETLDHDLDAILGELCALENNLTPSRTKPTPPSSRKSTPPKLAPPPLPPVPASAVALDTIAKSEPQYISAESVRQAKQQQKQQQRTDSPDNDSAFCDNISSNSSNGSSGNGKTKSSVASQETISIRSLDSNASRPEELAAKAKAEKIRIAIEKIKEASIKKIFIKVFGEDGSAKSLLVDERMTVAQVCRMLSEKNHIKRDTAWGLVELLPDLHMERAYEDHEMLVENLLMWKADSKNTLWFIKRPEVYDLFTRPEMYLLGETSSQSGHEMEDHARSELVEEYFSSTGVGAPEVEGSLWLKAEGKKTWKKFYFVLRTSGLYYAPKGKKTSKDLVCLARFDVNQVYFGVKWQPKFKSPTKHCFAIKHPQIQAKNPKYIRYLCADSEAELNKWVTGIRLAKHGKQLFDNFRGIVEDIAHDDLDRLASSRFSVHSNAAAPDPARTPDSANENKSFDSAVHSTDGPPSVPLKPLVLSESNTVLNVNTGSPDLARSARSGSAGSLSEKSSGLSSVEQGFNCDSPEGGTIKKKPTAAKPALVTFRPESPKNSKEVRFKDTYEVEPLNGYLPPPPPEVVFDRSSHESAVYSNIEEILRTNRTVLDAPRRPASMESLVSNPSMLHCGTLMQEESSPRVQLSPQPKRPAPVLKPAVSRKPSLDKNFLQMRKQQAEERGLALPPPPPDPRPTYEETLRKCESLTRQHSDPSGQNGRTPVVRQNSTPESSKPFKPPSPIVPPKPSLAGGKRISHLPPSGLHRTPSSRSHSLQRRPPVPPSQPPPSDSYSTLQRNHQKNGVSPAFLNDLQNAMTSRNGDVTAWLNNSDQPFPNRYSSGEYDNVSVPSPKSGGGTLERLKRQSPEKQYKMIVPTPPKRNDETHVTWKRS